MERTCWTAVRWMALAALLSAQAGCALIRGGIGAEPRETPAQAAERQTREESIRREVEARMAAEPAIGAGRIRAVVKNGDVQLHGAAPGFGALQCAIANAELVPGVQLVVDMMVLQPGPARVSCRAPRVFGATASAP
jgi:osmotically-inducible protein OsmY